MALRLLALHGFGQNACLFAEKRVKDISKKLRACLTLHAIEAPFPVPYDSTLRCWWQYPEDYWDGSCEEIQSLLKKLFMLSEFDTIGYQESVDLVLAEWDRGNYDGILGFSQGAILAAAVSAELHQRGCPPRFSILISGFGKPVPRGHAAYPPKQPLAIPSLHMWGLGDDHVPPWASEHLAEYFVAPRVHKHPGGHFVPQKAADLAVLEDFLKPFLVAASPAADPAGPATAPAKKSVQEASVATADSNALLGRTVGSWDELTYALQQYMTPRSWHQVAKEAAPLSTTLRKSGEASSAQYLPEELAPPGVGTHGRLLDLVQSTGVDFTFLGPHPPCRTSEDAVQVRLQAGWKDVTLHGGAKAMLMKTAKLGWLLCVVPADCKLSWKKVRALYGKGTRMATEEEVCNVAGCLPGAVPPIASSFPMAVDCLADATLPKVINFNCGLRTRSMQMSRAAYELVESPKVGDIIE